MSIVGSGNGAEIEVDPSVSICIGKYSALITLCNSPSVITVTAESVDKLIRHSFITAMQMLVKVGMP